MEIDLLYFDDCPSWQSALANLKIALTEEGLDAQQVRLVKIENAEDANKMQFLGSPSIHFDHVDLWPEEREEYLLGCRLYLTPDGLRGWPTVEMIRKKIVENQAKSGSS